MKKFRTLEISDPTFENDFLRYITVKSKNLKGRGDICVFVPPGVDEIASCPLVILLHGVYGSSWSWTLSGGVHISILEMIKNRLIHPMVIAMPSDGLWGDGSAYLPHSNLDFEKWIAEDVPAAIKECIPSVNDQSKMFIGGLSMGGFGAFKIGVKYHRIFSAIAAHSSITNLQQMELFVEEGLQDYSQEDKTEEDVFATIEKYKDHLPAIRFDCGTSDPLLGGNRLLHQQLLDIGVLHDYEEYEGAHEWPYWQKHVEGSMLFFSKYFK
ncbi:MAG: alpha/beta hydrolase-fold protein [Ginsengibacter sp.]